jgi:hypothetical protein
VTQGSGQALLDALAALARDSGHTELASAPLLLWGMSAGGQFNYEFVAWKPGFFFVGGKDLEFRTNAIAGLFAINRRAGAVWAFAEEPGAGHVVGRSRDMSLIFFAEMLRLRLVAHSLGANAASLRPLHEESGFIGYLKGRTFASRGVADVPNYPTAWLRPNELRGRGSS